MRTDRVNPLYVHIKWRIEHAKNCVIVINGSTGSGKSYASLRIAEDVAKLFNSPFSVKDNVGFKFSDLLKKMMLPKNQGKGVPYVFEEVGAMGGGAASREWQTKANRMFFSFMQTSRHRNQILIFTCPQFTFLESGTRRLCHLQLTTQGINFRTKVCSMKPFVIQVNPNSGKMYFKYIRYKLKGIPYKLTRLDVTYPSKDIVKEYEEEKLKFTTALNQSIIDEEEPKEKVGNKWIKLSQAEGMTGVNATRLSAWIKKGLIKGQKIGKLWCISSKLVEEIQNNPKFLENLGKSG